MYEYDVFLSYKRGKIPETWLNETFKPLFEFKLSNALGRINVPIFVDKTEIRNGVEWSSIIENALLKSKVMVALISPTYFNSDWCVKEFKSMFKRQQELWKRNLLDKNFSLVTPIVQQGPLNKLPELIHHIQFVDYTRFMRVGRSFHDSEEFQQLQELMEKDVQQTALMIERVPDWAPHFASTEWLDTDDIVLNTPVIKQLQPTFSKAS